MENLEQPELNNEGSKMYGKFKDAESLLKAYNNLEAEFTKKSQKLSMLEGENEKVQNELIKQAEREKKVEEFVNKFEFVKPFSGALKESLLNNESADINVEALNFISKTYKTAEDYSKDDEFLNNYIFSNKEIKDKTIKDYLKNITQNSPIKMDSGSGSISLTPPSLPKTLSEAGKLAKSIIKQK
ncbi:MAG: hypothetical protein IJW36_00980 [Clostridia bacterium]|nr:hypothetical protein [Clostridia bacterium]